MKFKIGQRVCLNTKWSSYKRNVRDWEKLEKRPYMIVTEVRNDGWLRFDNKRYTERGGWWNPYVFTPYTGPVVKLPESLFEI